MRHDTEKYMLIIEPFYGGSHKMLIDNFTAELSPSQYELVVMTPKKWHWRARSSALYLSTKIPRDHKFKVLFCTSVLPLAELIALRQDLSGLLKIVYFHENQLAYPVRVIKERDFQYGYNEILSCIVADKVLFNSEYNKSTFLSKVDGHLKLQPDYVTKLQEHPFEHKCSVAYFPIDLQGIDNCLKTPCDVACLNNAEPNDYLHIVWPHRWEADKNPGTFVRVMKRLLEHKLKFKLSIIGQTFTQLPQAFENVPEEFTGYLHYFGYIEDKREYYQILKTADVVVSTATHEFFGVAVMEAVYCGCVPVVPKKLAYKELYEGTVQELYKTEDDLYHILAQMCNEKARREYSRSDYSHLATFYDSRKWTAGIMEMIKNEINTEVMFNTDQQVPENMEQVYMFV